MNISRKTALIGTLLAACMALGTASTALAAASAYACKNLEKASEIQLLEGKDGMFFRIIPDLKMFHPMTDAAIRDIAAISEALKRNGTTLVYVPVPTKSMVLPELLPEDAKLYGFESGIANSVYDDVIKRLSKQGVVTVDIAKPMRAHARASNGDLAFFRTDFHWTAQGASAAAREIARQISALPDFSGKANLEAEAPELPAVQIQSTMHRIVQNFCRLPVPSAKAHPYDLKASAEDIFGATGEAAQGADIFGNDDNSGIALAGTSFSDMDVADFAGFLGLYSGLPVENHSITGGNQFGSILSYLTSREYKNTKPKYLIWENPIYNNIAQFGDGPLLEILAAAGQNCGSSLVANKIDARTLVIDVKDRKLSKGELILADVGGDRGRKATFKFASADGMVREREVERGERLRSTGRYFLPLSDLDSESFSTLSVSFDVDIADSAAVSLCKIQTGEQTQ